MELKKGENMVEHEAEIFARPARTWFQSETEKLAAKSKVWDRNRILADTCQRRGKDRLCRQFPWSQATGT